jgi:hypothetical protein
MHKAAAVPAADHSMPHFLTAGGTSILLQRLSRIVIAAGGLFEPGLVENVTALRTLNRIL